MTRNYYDVLGVDAQASPEQIQAAYIHWANKLSAGKDAPPTEPLKVLQRAYSVLGNPLHRRVYDSQAREAEPMRAPATAAKGYFLRSSFESGHPSFDELFDRLWSNFSEVSRPKAERLESLMVEVPISMEEAEHGGHARILIPARARCPACSGHGALGVYQCWQCEGKGAITADYPIEVAYPPGVAEDYLVQLPLNQFGISNFYLTVRFRVTSSEEASE